MLKKNEILVLQKYRLLYLLQKSKILKITSKITKKIITHAEEYSKWLQKEEKFLPTSSQKVFQDTKSSLLHSEYENNKINPRS